MSSSQIVYQAYEHRISDHLQNFQNMRNILLNTIWETLINAQLKSEDSTNKMPLTSLKQCQEALDICLKLLKESDYDLRNICETLGSYKIDHILINKYIVQLGDAICRFVEDNEAIGDLDAAKNTLEAIFEKILSILQLGIQMLEFLTLKDSNSLSKLEGNVFFKSKLPGTPKLPTAELPEEDSSAIKSSDDITVTTTDTCDICDSCDTCDTLMKTKTKSNQRSSFNCSRLGGGARNMLKSVTSRMDNTFGNKDYAKHVRKFHIEVHKNIQNVRMNDSLKPLESGSPRLSLGAAKILMDSMKVGAAFVIEAFLGMKTSLSAPIKCDISLSGNKSSDYGLDEIWIDLCDLHNETLTTHKDIQIDELRDTLTKFYLNKMQMLLQKNPVKIAYQTWKKFGRRSTARGSSFSKPANQTLSEQRVIALHKQFYTAQIEKLRDSRKKLNTRRLYYLIMNQSMPSSRSEEELFQQYETDPEHFNVLMMIINRDSQRETLLQIIERNFAQIKSLIDRQKRRQNMFKTASRFMNSRINCAFGGSTNSLQLEQTVFDNEFFKVERAKWAKYFSEKKMTPTQLRLATLRHQRQMELNQQRLKRKQKKLLKRKIQGVIRPLVQLYEAPRVTNRVRHAMEKIAGREALDLCSESLHKPFIHREQSCPVKQSYLSDALLTSESWTSSCSECLRLQRQISCHSALDRFHRTQEQIMSSTNYCDYIPR